jgi:predicted DCC family thiol-disulfide oxidoreductase YuxK
VPDASTNSIVLYDGVCGLCDRLTQFLLKRDHRDRFRFAPLQSDFAAEVLKRHGKHAADLDTVHVVLDHGLTSEHLLTRSDAIIEVVSELGGVWKIVTVAKLLPHFIRDPIYNLVARNRYRIFGKYDSCMLPRPEYRHKLIGELKIDD